MMGTSPRSPTSRGTGSTESTAVVRPEHWDALPLSAAIECMTIERLTLGKMARSAPRPPFGPPVVLGAVRTSRLAYREGGKALIFTPVRESSGESQLRSCRKSRSDASASPKKLQVIIYLCSGGAAFVNRRQYRDQGGQHMQ